MEFKNMVFDTDSEDEILKKFNLKKAEEKLDRNEEISEIDNDDDYNIVPLLNKGNNPKLIKRDKNYHQMSDSDNEKNDEKIKLNKNKSPKSKKHDKKNEFIENEHEMSNSDNENEDKVNIVSKLNKSKSPKSKKHEKKKKFIENNHEEVNKKSENSKLQKPYKSKEYIEDNSETSDSNNDEKIKNSASKIRKKIKIKMKSPKNHDVSKTPNKSKEYIEDNSETDSNNDEKINKIHKKIKTESKSPKKQESQKKISPVKNIKRERSISASNTSSSDENKEINNSKIRLNSKITEYLSTLKNHVKSPYKSTIDLNSLNPEEDNEIYVIHCPKKLDITQLKNAVISFNESKKLKLEDKKIEWNLIKSESIVNLIGTKNNNLVNKTVQISGVVNLSLQLKKNGVVTFNSIKSDKVPIPADLKRRHPIFGLDFKKSLQLDEDVIEKLKAAEKNKSKINKKILKSSLNKYNNSKISDQKMSEEFTNFLSDFTSDLNVKVKKEVIEDEDGEEFVKKKKKSKRKLTDDSSEYKKSKKMKFL